MTCQVTVSRSRAVFACHHVSATIATPPARLWISPSPSRMNACRTPGMPCTSSRLAVATFPPNTGAFSYTAHSMLGTVKSMLKIGLPVTMARLSTPGVALPMMV